MVNVVNLNFLVAANDVDVPEGALDLDFSRVYNSESQHDKNNDDGAGPSVFGNRWTNNLDVHLGWTSTGQNTGIVSVYTADGARDDYACEIDVVETCSSLTPGVYDLLGTTDLNSGTACQIQWTKKSGVSYLFYAPYAACNDGAGEYGRLTAIYGRNSSFYITLGYSWAPDDSNLENLTAITAIHEPDGALLDLQFGQIQGTSITELMTLVRPDGETVNYHYTNGGDLDGVDKPGNNPVLLGAGEPLPTQFADGSPIVQGNLPETYDIQPGGLLEVCGPRAAITILDNNVNSSLADGACVDFDYNNQQLSDWYTRGVLNPTPGDGVISQPMQNGPNTGFVQWDDTAFFNIISGCGAVTTEMTDAYGHATEWCYDSSSRVTQMSVQASSSSWLTTQQSWDANNDLTSTTDARQNTTNIAYDSNGNVVEVALPSQSTSQGTLRPTYFMDYDSQGHNNLMKYCDPSNNASNGWNPNPGPTPCAASGSSNYAHFAYNSGDANESYGCLTDTYKASGYHTAISYGANCGTGEPTTVTPHSYQQADTSQRNPMQTFVYNSNGTLHQYNPGTPDGTVWQLTYDTIGMNRVQQVTDPDGVSWYRCYNLDGSVFYSESPTQRGMDGASACPSNSQLIAGATPPTYAAAYGYDPDGDPATILSHHNCIGTGSTCTAIGTATTKCRNAYQKAGTTCDFYDGLDRLVEVKLPYDSSVDLYEWPWITRYLYDLDGTSKSYRGNQIYAYGNLFRTQELLYTAAPSVTGQLSAGSLNNNTLMDLKDIAYDGLDRPVTKYSNEDNNGTYTTETFFWDTSPLDPSGVAGFLGQDCNSASPTQQCQEYDYLPDGEMLTFSSSDGSSPTRGYTYDPDGRITKITQTSKYSLPQTYAYTVNGDLLNAQDAANNGNDQATLTYTRYPDGLEEYLSVAQPSVLNQTNLLQYSYRNDGPVQTEAIQDNAVSGIQHSGKTTIAYGYTDAGRLASRGETGAAADPAPTPQTQITYSSGLMSHEITPVTTLSSFSYSAEDELLSVSSSGGNGSCGPPQYSYSLRGELVNSTISNCNNGSAPYMANGVALRGPLLPNGQHNEYVWNALFGVLTFEADTTSSCYGSTECFSSWNYQADGAGRMTLENAPYPPFNQNPPPTVTATQRTYDAENHLTKTQFQVGSSSTYENETVAWGPDGHPIKIGTHVGSNNDQNERLHWNGGQLLFTTHQQQNGQSIVDDIKIDAQGDILPNDLGYNGLTFYDRDPGGTIMGCHNYSATQYAGIGDSWIGNGIPCIGTNMPTSGVWGANPYFINSFVHPIGSGGTLTMTRTDGFNDGFDTIQGARSYDNNSGSWTAPDAVAGVDADPASQKSYLWNGNNPMDNTDPTGDVFNHSQPVNTPMPPPPPPSKPSGCDSAADKACGDLKVIAHVYAFGYRKPILPWCNDNSSFPIKPPIIPRGATWSGEYQAGLANFTPFGAWHELVDVAPFNFQVQGKQFRPASNFGLGIFGTSAMYSPDEVIGAIIGVAMLHHHPEEISDDVGWAMEGYLWAQFNCLQI